MSKEEMVEALVESMFWDFRQLLDTDVETANNWFFELVAPRFLGMDEATLNKIYADSRGDEE
jgi:hypothetical protein